MPRSLRTPRTSTSSSSSASAPPQPKTDFQLLKFLTAELARKEDDRAKGDQALQAAQAKFDKWAAVVKNMPDDPDAAAAHQAAADEFDELEGDVAALLVEIDNLKDEIEEVGLREKARKEKGGKGKKRKVVSSLQYQPADLQVEEDSEGEDAGEEEGQPSTTTKTLRLSYADDTSRSALEATLRNEGVSDGLSATVVSLELGPTRRTPHQRPPCGEHPEANRHVKTRDHIEDSGLEGAACGCLGGDRRYRCRRRGQEQRRAGGYRRSQGDQAKAGSAGQGDEGSNFLEHAVRVIITCSQHQPYDNDGMLEDDDLCLVASVCCLYTQGQKQPSLDDRRREAKVSQKRADEDKMTRFALHKDISV